MNQGDIITGENNIILRKISKEIEPKVAKKVIAKMSKIIKKQPALGLAAPQIGKNVRVIMVRIGRKFVPMINPEVISFSLESAIAEEGCLSLPGIWANVSRHSSIEVKFIDAFGNPKSLKLEDLDARIVQHEIDHLDGVLFIDRISAEKNNIPTVQNA